MGMYMIFMVITVPCMLFLLYCLTPRGRDWMRQNNLL